MPATEYRIRPSDAATSTMQMAMKIVEMRIMLRGRPSSPGVPWAGARFAQAVSAAPWRPQP
jgi:hypothetical protein